MFVVAPVPLTESTTKLSVASLDADDLISAYRLNTMLSLAANAICELGVKL